ncbi:MAG: hypothetical protein AVDCRST_MAG06-3323, partial [uncultured Nocardioides sp.]
RRRPRAPAGRRRGARAARRRRAGDEPPLHLGACPGFLRDGPGRRHGRRAGGRGGPGGGVHARGL